MRNVFLSGRRLARAACFVALSCTSCGDDDSSTDKDAAPAPVLDAALDAFVTPTADAAADAAVFAGPVLPRPSQSGSVDISPDDRWVVMVNREDDSVSVFDTTLANARTAFLPTGEGSDPYAVVIHPDGKTAFVALRGAAAVIKISGIDTATPTVSAPLGVGSEPTGLALAPSGRKLFVAEHAEGSIAVIDTASMAEVGLITGPDHPYALAVSNDLDGEDADETLIAPEFFGVPTAGGVGETKDNGRTGLVRRYALADLSPLPAITLAPIDSGFCATCHGGSGWSVSPLFFTHSSAGNLALQSTPLVVPSIVKNPHSFQIAPEPPIAVGGMATPPNQIACVIRNVKTFGVFGDAAATTAVEVKNSGMARAQGEGGYNVPSLYGMALDAPYLHHGQAPSLEVLFTSGAFTDHLRAGNANFLPNDATAPADRAALIAFVTSIDATTAEFDIPASYDICPTGP